MIDNNMLILILILFSCYTHAMHNDSPAQDLQEWIETLKPAPLDQNETTDTNGLIPALQVHLRNQSTNTASTRKKEHLEKLSLQQIPCPLSNKGCPWVCVYTKPTATLPKHIIQANCAYMLRDHCIQEHFSLEVINCFVGNEMDKEIKVNLDNCDTDNLYALANTLIDTNE